MKGPPSRLFQGRPSSPANDTWKLDRRRQGRWSATAVAGRCFPVPPCRAARARQRWCSERGRPSLPHSGCRRGMRSPDRNASWGPHPGGRPGCRPVERGRGGDDAMGRATEVADAAWCCGGASGKRCNGCKGPSRPDQPSRGLLPAIPGPATRSPSWLVSYFAVLSRVWPRWVVCRGAEVASPSERGGVELVLRRSPGQWAAWGWPQAPPRASPEGTQQPCKFGSRSGRFQWARH